MFSFTTYSQASFMGMHDKEDELLAPRGEFTVKNAKPIFLSAYIHGDAENLVGYDLPVFIDGELGDELEQDCIMKFNGEQRDCIFIQWATKSPNMIMEDGSERQRYKGLLCLKTDEESIKYARDCAKERKSCL